MAYPPPPYVDAVTGTPVAGEAITGAWWAYAPQGGLLLGGYEPEVTAIADDVPPPAGLKLGAFPPTLVIDSGVLAPEAGLQLGAYAPSFRLSTILQPGPAGLLLGAYLPSSVGAAWLTPNVCTDLVLTTAPESELVLVAAGGSDLALDPLECL